MKREIRMQKQAVGIRKAPETGTPDRARGRGT